MAETLFTRLTRRLQNAIGIHAEPSVAPARNVRVLPVSGRVRMPSGNMPRVREIDGPTIRIPRAGEPGVNAGARYTPRPGVVRHRAADNNNSVPTAFTRQRVA